MHPHSSSRIAYIEPILVLGGFPRGTTLVQVSIFSMGWAKINAAKFLDWPVKSKYRYSIGNNQGIFPLCGRGSLVLRFLGIKLRVSYHRWFGCRSQLTLTWGKPDGSLPLEVRPLGICQRLGFASKHEDCQVENIVSDVDDNPMLHTSVPRIRISDTVY